MRRKGMVWFSFLLLLASFIPNLMQAYIVYAQSPEEINETVIKSESLNLSTVVKQENEQMLWEIKYEMTSPDTKTKQRVKLKLYNGELIDTNLVAPEKIEGWGYNTDNWFMPEQLSQTVKGSIYVKTALSVTNLTLKVQMDEEVTSQKEVEGVTTEEKVVTENILEAPLSEPHLLSAPIVKVEVASESVTAPSVTPKAETASEAMQTTEREISTTPSETSSETQTSTETIETETFTSESTSNKVEFVDDEGTLKSDLSRGDSSLNSLNTLVSPFSLNPYVDAFDYTTDTLGKYPTQWTNRHLPDINSNVDIRNFNYLQTVTGRTPANNNAGQVSPANQVVNIKDSTTLSTIVDSNGNVKSGLTSTPFTNFADGYVAYWQPNDIKNLATAQEKFSKLILNKKTVKATADPTKFEVELDVIGGVTVNPDRLVDVVFVVDKSSSMNSGTPTRWASLKTAMTKFTDTLLTPENALGDGGKGYLRMGLAGFGSNGSDEVFGEIGTFSGGVGFTSDKTTFNNHPLIKDQAYSNSGTPTFLGLDAGIEMLTNSTYGARSNAEKVIIILTDGLPTFGVGSNYSNLTSGSTLTTSGSGNTTKKRYSFKNSQNATYFTGNGMSATSAIRTSTINHANSRPTTTIKRYAIGFGVSDVADILTALGPQGQGEASSQQDLDDILTYFANVIGPKTPYINNATINDPMSPYVTLDTSSVTITPLTLTLGSNGTNILNQPSTTPSYITDITKTFNNGITLSKVTLSGTANANRLNDVKYGLRLKYTVTLKEAYRDGLFYQTNGPTYLEQNSYTNSLGFTVPSVRYKPNFNIPVEKSWVDDNNNWVTRQPITLQLEQKIGTGNWTSVVGQSITLPANGPYTSSFNNVPYYSGGQLVEYRVVELGRVVGYDDPVISPISINGNTTNKKITITNTLLYRDVVFKKTKSDGTTPLADVQFTIRKKGTGTPVLQTVTSTGTGEVKFTHLPIGEYVIEEVAAPENYKPITPINIKIEDQEKNLVITGLPPGEIVKNHLKDYELVVTKEDNQGGALEGATFELKRTDITPNVTIPVTVTTNKFTFTNLPAPGSYLLTETSAPEGFVGIEPVIILIAADGSVTVTGNESQIDQTDVNKNIIKLTVKNQRKGQLPTTGGQGTMQFIWTTIAFITLAGAVGAFYVYRNKKGAK